MAEPYPIQQIKSIRKYGPEQLSRVASPIEVNEDWLRAFGFTKSESMSFRWHYNYFKLGELITYDLDDHCICIAGCWEFGARPYVHQLQNLVYALTGEELTREGA